MTRSPIQVTVCREHGLALVAAARGCGASTEAEQLAFLADMLEAVLYSPVQRLAGDDAGHFCVCCCYINPDEAILDAVAGALSLRKKYGVRDRLN